MKIRLQKADIEDRGGSQLLLLLSTTAAVLTVLHPAKVMIAIVISVIIVLYSYYSCFVVIVVIVVIIVIAFNTVGNSCRADSPTSCQGYDCNITQKRESEEKDFKVVSNQSRVKTINHTFIT